METKPRCIIDGEPWWDFLFTYRFEGKEYGFAVCARNEAEAMRRLSAMGMARYDGRASGEPIPAHRGWMIPLIVWWANLWAGK